jgi:hypothetical protein
MLAQASIHLDVKMDCGLRHNDGIYLVRIIAAGAALTEVNRL